MFVSCSLFESLRFWITRFVVRTLNLRFSIEWCLAFRSCWSSPLSMALFKSVFFACVCLARMLVLKSNSRFLNLVLNAQLNSITVDR